LLLQVVAVARTQAAVLVVFLIKPLEVLLLEFLTQ
jgi:hypothetical protein